MINEILNDTQKLIFVALFSVALLQLVTAVIWLIITKIFVTNAIVTKAKIIKFDTSSDNTKAYVVFNDHLGSQTESNLLISMNKYKVGSEIEILSDKHNPKKVKLNTFLSLWLMPIILAEGAVMMAIVLAILVYSDIASLPF